MAAVQINIRPVYKAAPLNNSRRQHPLMFKRGKTNKTLNHRVQSDDTVSLFQRPVEPRAAATTIVLDAWLLAGNAYSTAGEITRRPNY
jgi:hypothetical protein